VLRGAAPTGGPLDVTRYAALLRGVNVSGRNRVDMLTLRARLGEAGYRDVTTYIQSGNVVFSTAARAEAELVRALEAELRGAFGLEITVLIRTGPQLRRVATQNPWLEQRGDPSALHVTFLAAPPPRAQVRALAARAAGPDDAVVVGREVYLRCPNGYGKTKLNNAHLERVLGVPATTRNWKTVLTLRELLES
jgi:uncharacterized protein (DUF1697 family)